MKRTAIALAMIAVGTLVLIVDLWMAVPAPVAKQHVVVHKHPVILYVTPTTTTTTVPAPPAPVYQAVAPKAPAAPVAAPAPLPVATTTTTAPVRLSFLAEAQTQIGVVNPPYDNGGNFWCYLFVNWVGDNSNLAGSGWVDSQDPGGYEQTNQVDPNGPQPGDIALYGDTSQMAEGNDYIVHVGIVESVDQADGTFVAIEGNGESANGVVETTRPISGDGPEGFSVYEFLLP